MRIYQGVCSVLRHSIPHYTWVGVYILKTTFYASKPTMDQRLPNIQRWKLVEESAAQQPKPEQPKSYRTSAKINVIFNASSIPNQKS